VSGAALVSSLSALPMPEQCSPAPEPVPPPTCYGSHNIGVDYVYGVRVENAVGYCEPNGAGQVRAVVACWNGVQGQYTWRSGEIRTKVDDVDLWLTVKCNTTYPFVLPGTVFVEVVA
jgi:hypothetical protein